MMNLSIYIKEIRKKGQRYFTLKQLMSDLSLSKNAALNAIFRIKQHGDLISPMRGLYVIVPPECQSYGSIPAEELIPIIMKHIDTKYYVALLSAAAFYGASHQKPMVFQIISDKRIQHSLNFGQVHIKLIYKKSLDELPTQDFIVSNGYLKVATPELVAIDLLKFPNHAGGINNIATVLSELVETIDVHKLIQCAKNMREQHQLQRLGYIIEKVDVMDEDKKNTIIAALVEYVENKIKSYIPLVAAMPRHGYPRCKKWQIIENTDFESDL